MRIETRYLSGRQADTGTVLFERHLEAPVCVYAENLPDTYEERENQTLLQRQGIILIPPYENLEKIEAGLQKAAELQVLAAGIALDRLYDEKGSYLRIEDEAMGEKTTEDLKRLQSCAEKAGIPFLVKGILSQRDAYQCLKAGVSGIILSRPVWLRKSSITPLEILPEILKVTAGEMKVLVELESADGMDMFAAVALGADGVCKKILPLENPIHTIASMQDELRCIMSAAGCRDLSHMDSTVIWKDQTESD